MKRKRIAWNKGKNMTEVYGLERANKTLFLIFSLLRERNNFYRPFGNLNPMKNPENCISLCHSCHQKTNYNRGYWFELFRKILSDKYNYKYPTEFRIIKFQNKEVKYENDQ